MGGGKGGGNRPPPRPRNPYAPPKQPGRKANLEMEDIKENADGTFSARGVTAETRGELARVLAARAPKKSRSGNPARDLAMGLILARSPAVRQHQGNWSKARKKYGLQPAKGEWDDGPS